MNEIRRAIVCGGRDFDENNYPGIREALTSLFFKLNINEEVCGMAVGADMFGSEVANSIGIKVSDFYADWNMKRPEFANDPVSIRTNRYGCKYNVIAGINRNRRMAEYVKGCGFCIALPGGSGTRDMIRQAKNYGIPVYEWKDYRPHDSKFELIYGGSNLK